MDAERKLRMFETLVRVGFKEIEVGFPSASQTEFDFVRKLIEDNLIPDDVTIQVLTPAREPLIERTFEAVRGAKRVIMHLYNATAPMMRKRRASAWTSTASSSSPAATRASSRNWPRSSPTRLALRVFAGDVLRHRARGSRARLDAVTDVWQPTPERTCIINLPTTVEHRRPTSTPT
jgi:2-isopropylmalate synthase